MHRRLALSLFALLTLVLQALFPQGLFAAPPVLRCEIRQGGQTFTEDFVPVTDPYAVDPKEINHQFLFKAVVMGNEENIDYIRIYTYYKEQHQVILLHEAKYLPPFRHDVPSPAALTGVNYLYAPVLEQEFQYGCVLLDDPS
jgi:hypothetical protein